MAELMQAMTLSQDNRPLQSRETLQRCLDDLLERYLHLLDHYQKLQQDLKKAFSDGFLSLAQANFSNANRIRYGQDYYDDRMQASAVISVSESRPSFATLAPKACESSINLEAEEREIEKPPREDEANRPSQMGKEHLSPGNPLHWFGILVPQALRAAQSDFQVAVTDGIPHLASISKEMKEVEIDIRRARKKLNKVG